MEAEGGGGRGRGFEEGKGAWLGVRPRPPGRPREASRNGGREPPARGCPAGRGRPFSEGPGPARPGWGVPGMLHAEGNIPGSVQPGGGWRQGRGDAAAWRSL